MNTRQSAQHRGKGFTIVELLVVVAVIAILAAMTIVGYGAWRNSTVKNVIKSDLVNAAATMESSRTFTNMYPSSLPTTFQPSSNMVITVYSATATTYCLDGSYTGNSIKMYVASDTKSEGAKEGTCATRPFTAPPTVPATLATTSIAGTSVGLGWTLSTGASTYVAQCASDIAFTVNLREATTTTTTATVTGLSPSSTFFCRVKAVNSLGSSAWSSVINTSTNNSYGSLAIGTSLEGYWTTAPEGYLLENGAAVSRTAYGDLFALIGTTFGAGDGSTTFNLPDSRGRTAVNKSTDVEFASTGQFTGSKLEGLTIAQMPSHTHVQNSHTHSAGARTEASGGGIASGWAGVASAARSGTNNYTLDIQVMYVAPTTATNQDTGGDETHNNLQPSITRTFAIKFRNSDTSAESLPAASSIEGYWSAAPDGYLLEDGSAVSRSTYAELFASIGTTYGAGNGSTTFNLPDSRGRAAVNISSADAEFDTMGEKPGAKRETISIATMPSHTHVQNGHTHSIAGRTDASGGGSASGFGGVGSSLRSNTNNYTQEDGTVIVSAATATNQNTGGGSDHNNIQPAIVKMAAIKYAPAGGTDQPIAPGSSIKGYWTGAVPAGYLFEDGSAVSRATYPNLFAAIGTTYGAGNGSTTFNLPDSRGRLAVNIKTGDSDFGSMGQKVGVKSVTLTIAQLPTHTHVQDAHTHSAVGRNEAGSGGQAGGWGGAASSVRVGTNNYTADNQYVATATVAAVNQNTGGGGAHNNIMPSIVKKFIIKF